MQLAVRDRAAAEETFGALLGAEKVREDASELLAASRTVMRAGISEFELLQPSGDGLVQQHLDRWGEGIFAGGFSTDDLDVLVDSLSGKGVEWKFERGQVYIEADQTPGMRMVLTEDPADAGPSTGLITWLYEVTNIVEDHEWAARFYAGAFGLDERKFCPIRSKEYGYKGQLTLFDPPNRLDRIELSQITDPERAMGRFAAKRGQSIYMCYVETNDVPGIRARLEARGARYAGRRDDNPDGLFIHPSSLHGMLMGVSRTNLAWQWSGRPELAQAPA
jgi:hypothetical protein